MLNQREREREKEREREREREIIKTKFHIIEQTFQPVYKFIINVTKNR